MEQSRTFSILDSVDSTNNYAMGQVHAGLAKHGMAWFANTQSVGKGQRGKAWLSNPCDNIILSIVIQPNPGDDPSRFFYPATIALTCITFLHSLTGENFTIKWPNDVYWGDRKAGGILIENVIRGTKWKWSVIGIGININQTRFPVELNNPVSIKNICGREYSPISLAKQLHVYILNRLEQNIQKMEMSIIAEYNVFLYKKNAEVKLRKNKLVFKTHIKEVDLLGNLHTKDAIERSFAFGEVEWVIG